MKKLVFPLFIIVLFIATSCSSIKVSSDFDKAAGFAAYKTYAFTPEAQGLKLDDLNRNRLLGAIEKELTAKGFTKSETPDVLIDIKIKLKEQQTATATSNSPYGYGYGYRYGGGFTTTTINYDTYIDGTIFVDMIDASKKELVWQGRGTGTIDPDASQAKREKNINYAVKQIFMKYPPVIK
jgi:hypothetical protein